MARTTFAAEPTFEEAQSWWRKMQRPVTFTGVPGHPLQPTVLWNAGLLFCSNPREYSEGRPRLGAAFPLAWGLSLEMQGYELDALHMEFSFGEDSHLPDRLDNTGGEVQQELLEGRMPVIINRVSHDGLLWTGTVFSRLAEDPDLELEERDLLTEVRWLAENRSDRSRAAQLTAHFTCPHVVLGYKVKMSERAYPYLRRLSWHAPLVLDDRGLARAVAVVEGEGDVTFLGRFPKEQSERLAGLGLAQDALQFSASVAAGGSVSFRLIVPFYAAESGVLRQALRTRCDRALAQTQRAWARTFAATRMRTPEQIVNDCCDAYLYHAMIATNRRPRTGQAVPKLSPNNYEGMWSGHSAIAAHSMDLRGEHAWSRQILESFLLNQGPIPSHILNLFGERPVSESEGFSHHPGFLGNIEGFMAVLWAQYHGWILWAIGQHARLTNDWKWLKGHADRLALACEWVEAQRRRTRLHDGNGEKALSYGLLPAANAFDWGFGHFFWSDAHTYRGLKEIADCLQRVRHPKAAQYLAQAEDYRNDIITSVTRSRDASAPVPRDDGTTIPFVPQCVEVRDYFAPDWTYISCGPLNLAWAGVVPADHELIEQTLAFLDAGRPLGAWDEGKKKHQGWDWPAQLPADEDFFEATRPKSGRCYLWRHKMCYEPGWIPQAFTFLRRDDLPALFEHLYSLISKGGQHVELRTPIEQRDGVAWTQPGDANLLWLMRSMLVREEGNGLILAGSCPRLWLKEGKAIEVEKLPTHFGAVSYRLVSGRSARTVAGSFRFEFHTKPATIRLRLRHPQAALPQRVTVNGKPVEADGEWIALPPTARRLEVTY